MRTTLEIDEVRAWIEGHGKTYAQIAKKIGVSRCELDQVLSSRTKLRRGKPHLIAVALRIKPAPSEFDKNLFVLPPVATVRRWLAENHVKPIPHPRMLKTNEVKHAATQP